MEAEHAGHHGEEVLGGAGSECLHVGRLPGFATSRRTTRSTCGEPDRGLRLCAITGPMAVGSRSMRAEASRSEEHTSELQSLMRISYAVFCLKTKQTTLHKLST